MHKLTKFFNGMGYHHEHQLSYASLILLGMTPGSKKLETTHSTYLLLLAM